MAYCVGIFLVDDGGGGHTVKNSIVICDAPETTDYIDISTGIIADKNISGDDTAPGTTTIHNAVAADEWVDPGTDFHLKAGAQARGFAELIPAYNYDFEGKLRS